MVAKMAGDKNRKILESFAGSYSDLLRHLTRRLGRENDAADVMQDTFLKLQSIPADLDIRNERSYLFRIADNLATDHLRRQQKIGQRFASMEDFDSPDKAPLADQVVDYRQRLARLEDAIAELPDRQRQVFLMHKYDGLSHSEIAMELRISRSAVEKLIMKALAHCRNRLGNLID